VQRCNHRTPIFGGSLIRGNRLEKGTVSLTDSLSCHTDNQNGRVLGFTYNVSHFKYHRNPAVLDPASKDAFQRTHMGGYSRKICDSTLEKADNVEALGELVLEYLKQAPEGNKSFDPSILERREGNEDGQYKDDVVMRDIHLNKVALYSFTCTTSTTGCIAVSSGITLLSGTSTSTLFLLPSAGPRVVQLPGLSYSRSSRQMMVWELKCQKALNALVFLRCFCSKTGT